MKNRDFTNWKDNFVFNAKVVHRNYPPAKLVEAAILNGEGRLTNTGALAITTGKYTGRSPEDKFIVDSPAVHDKISWGSVNKPMSVEDFEAIKAKMTAYLQNRELYIFDGFAGAEVKTRRKFRIVNTFACQNLFIHQLLIRPTEEELENFGEPDFTIIAAPDFLCDPETDHTHSEAAILVNFEERVVLIAGSQYSGEIKKSVFSVMNYLMPEEEDILPMHCSANMDPETNETAVFFGLSGTGKTTLSADPSRMLIGDDEHGWSDDGIFNFEGGCYAKCIHLDPANEPEIYNAIKFGSECENVVIDEFGVPDYDDGSITENSRVGYPIEYIDNAQIPGVGGIPKVVIFLTADAFGVLPPISRLDKNAAMYHFVTGFTSKLAGTERGIKEPVPTFSTLFGEPFMPLPAERYAQMLGEKITKYNTKVYLVNTGWSGGPYGVGSRMKLRYTRAMVTAALNGEIEKAEYKHDEIFNVDIPQAIEGCPADILNPRDTWADKAAYDAQAKKLAQMFKDNFTAKYPNMPAEIAEAGPLGK